MTADYLVVGINHRSWTASVRDRVFTEFAEVPGQLGRLAAAGLGQAVWLATCDRVEVVASHPQPARAVAAITAILAERASEDLGAQLRVLAGDAAVRHVFAVAASLDSQVVGEPQVLGQVKAAYRQAVAAGLVGSELEALMQAAFAVAKRIRGETGITERPTSIAAAAVDIARDLHGDLGRRRGLLVGLGDMGVLMAAQLREAGLGALTVMTPTDRRAELAAQRLHCHYAPFESLAGGLAASDIVVAAVGLGRHVLTASAVIEAVHRRRHQPMFIIDAALPTDVEPAVGEIEAAFLYDLSDLERVALRGRVGREAATAAAWSLLDQALASFSRNRAERAAVPIIAALRRHFEESRRQVLAEAGALGADEASRRLVNRLLHGPSEALRRLAVGAEGPAAAERLLRTLFQLEELESSYQTGNEDDAP